MLRSVLFLVVTLAASPALAAATDWQELAPGVRARLIASGPVENGRMLAGLELDMPSSTNTYWRIPGETGIPTILDFSGSAGVANAEIRWPFPLIEETQGYRDFVYRGPTVIPIELALDSAQAGLDVAANLGICEEMCVPVTARFALPLDTEADPAQSIRLRQALALAPIDWREETNAVGAITPAPSGDGIQLHDLAPGIDPAQLIADAGDANLLFGAPQKSPEAAIWTLPLLGGPGNSNLVGRAIVLTFLTSSGAYTANATVGPAAN
ncbi:MAG TPA: protein-disulfide reductase DsbD domain-containing protein [Devosia sp.]|nr:protein-disulfide reductase DsbD domain-containing protein [Devosia sp.]